MGSTSDLEVMTPAIETLEQFGIEVDKRVISAHRAPHELMKWVESARERELSIIIAGAGGAAHLAGVIAGLTTLPVIGVPIRSKTLDGLDSLLSIVQMPAGIPVATVAINGAKNAALGILAASIMTDETVTLENLPNVRDIRVLLQAMQEIGAKVEYVDKNTVKINGSHISSVSIDYEFIRKIRASYYLLGALLGCTIPGLFEGKDIITSGILGLALGWAATGGYETIKQLKK